MVNSDWGCHEGLSLVDEATFVFSVPTTTIPIKQILMEATLPAMMLWDDIVPGEVTQETTWYRIYMPIGGRRQLKLFSIPGTPM